MGNASVAGKLFRTATPARLLHASLALPAATWIMAPALAVLLSTNTVRHATMSLAYPAYPTNTI